MSKKILSVSIVLYKTPFADLTKCIESLKNISTSFDLFLVDNSPDARLRDLVDLCPGTAYFHLPNNPGYGSAHNLAIEKSSTGGYQFHLVINADVYFNDDVVTPMIEYMLNDEEVGQMMPKVLNPDGSIQRLCKIVPTPSDLFLRRFSPPRIREKNNSIFELHFSGYNKLMFVPYLSGCFMLLRHSCLKDVGRFDERFFMYPEDIDLTRRIAERYKTIFFPGVSVFHSHGGASRKSYKMFFIHLFNLVKYFNKWGWFFDSKRDFLNKKTLAQFIS